MTITPICSKCGTELTEFGGLLFSPPDADGRSKKWHLCRTCYDEVAATLE